MTVFQAVADPTRRRIVELLAEADRSVGEIVAQFVVSQPAISRHLRLLKEAGLVASHGDGKRRVYRLLPDSLSPLDNWIEQQRRVWNTRFDELEAHLEKKRHLKSKPEPTD